MLITVQYFCCKCIFVFLLWHELSDLRQKDLRRLLLESRISGLEKSFFLFFYVQLTKFVFRISCQKRSIDSFQSEWNFLEVRLIAFMTVNIFSVRHSLTCGEVFYQHNVLYAQIFSFIQQKCLFLVVARRIEFCFSGNMIMRVGIFFRKNTRDSGML